MCLNQNIFQRIIEEVGGWSRKNYGLQKSKWQYHAQGFAPVCPIIILDHVAPLLGIIEEAGELSDACNRASLEETKDAIGDVQIYLADYLYRQGLAASTIDWLQFSNDKTWLPAPDSLMVTVGRLAHINLKRHQGIRGYETDKFFYELKAVLTNLMLCLRSVLLTSYPRLTNKEAADAVITILGSTWKHVKERNWTANPYTGEVRGS
jgi:hypothetical protein